MAEELYVQFGQAILSRFEEFARSEPLPQHVGSYLAYIEGGYHDQYYHGTNYWHFYRTKHGEIFGKLEPADNCIREYLKLGILKVPSMSTGSGEPITNPTYEQMAAGLYHELLTPLMKEVEQSGTFRLTIDQIRKCHKEFQDSKLPPPTSMSLSINIPLVNFSTALPRTLIGKSLYLEPLPLDRKTFLWNRSFGSAMLGIKSDPGSFTQANFTLSASCIHTAGNQIRELPLFTDGRIVITALRLLKPGAVGTFAYYTDCNIARIGHVVTAWPSEELFSNGRDIPYSLNESDLPSLQPIMHGLRKNESAIQIPMRRFNQCYGRESNEDRIIDCVIALESCLLRGTGGAQLSYRFSLRGAALLAKTFPPRATRDLLDVIYQSRNEIVHGGGELSKLSERLTKNMKKLNPPVEVNQLAARCHEITREILRTYVLLLKDGETLGDINEHLDDRIADALNIPS